MAAIATTGIKPCVDQTFEVSRAAEAYDALQNSRQFGKLVITAGPV